MSPVEQPRRRADSIPDEQPVLEKSYRLSPSSPGPAHPGQDVDGDCPSDCPLATPSSTTTIEPFARHQSPQPQNDDMLSVPQFASGSDMQAPALPAKSSLRTSRLLASLAQKTVPEDRPILPHAAPHQVYLSSEEDASSSADDLSDLDDMDWDGQDSQKSSTSRSSREDTARVVTVIFHGRPSIVELTRKAGGVPGPQSGTGILRTATEPTLARSRSNSGSSASFQNPPRSSSMTPTGFQIKRKQFLTIDPFAARVTDHDEQESARTPKTPSNMLKKTLSLVKKRSKPILNPAASHSRESLALPTPPLEQLGEEPEPETPRMTSTTHRASMSYHGMVRSARKSAEAAAPTVDKTESLTPSPYRSRFRSGLSMGRPRSVRA
ncbi:hypothetical protein HIM_06401 [Hirsutella minnesotensis 3608]|uniref:Uncharacterized protein n=1 Tax=Hirsutella minnesotensis 3608 TaxID=1043627 RepID=A0A0F7ZNQ7_9HYPO|nr:hypothetical protein HIM_06401 [Hirsutella minnesotensis 3608]